MSLSNRKDVTRDLRDASGRSVDPSTVHSSLINGLHGKDAVKRTISGREAGRNG